MSLFTIQRYVSNSVSCLVKKLIITSPVSCLNIVQQLGFQIYT